jgi:PAS domain S-box-containing protein
MTHHTHFNDDLPEEVGNPGSSIGGSDARLIAVLDHIPAVMFVVHRDGHYLMVNERWEQLFNKRRGDVIGRRVEEVFPPEQAARFRESDERVCATNTTIESVQLFPTATGPRRLQVLLFPLRDDHGTPYAVCGISTDITEQFQVQESLVRNEERLRIALDVARMVTFDWDIASGQITWQGDYQSFIGITDEQAHTTMDELIELVYPDDRALVRGRIGAALAQPTYEPLTFRIIRPDGQMRWLLVRGVAFRDAGSRPTRMIGVAQDVTERVLADKALRDSEEQYRVLFDNNPHPMWLFDTETLAFVAVNDAMVHQYGYSREELLSMTIDDIRQPEEITRLHATLKTAKSYDSYSVWRHRKKDGTLFDVQISSHTIELNGLPRRLVMAQDITVRRALETQLRESQKIEAIGRLAGGVAHDFNNLLTAMIGYGQLVLDTLPPDDTRHHDITQMLFAARRAADLTRQLLAFARRQATTLRPTNLNDMVLESEGLLRRMVGEGVELTIHCDPLLGTTLIDAAQCTQMLINLVVNGRDAMPDGGTLTIATSNVWLDEMYARSHSDVQPGPYVRLSITDTGVGIGEVARAHLFEPFYTTKPVGQGTGLGLAVVHGIVSQARGHIWISSIPRQGTAFHIYLPRIDVHLLQEDSAAVADLRGGSETILVVEPEALVLDLLVHTLEGLGYRVLAASDGQRALELAETHTGPIDLLITDAPTARSGKAALLQALRWVRGGLRVLWMLSSGDQEPSTQADEDAARLSKPFTPAALARLVRAVLDQGPA